MASCSFDRSLPASAAFRAASSLARFASLKAMSPLMDGAAVLPAPDGSGAEELPAPLLLHAAAASTTTSVTAAAPHRPCPAVVLRASRMAGFLFERREVI